MVNTSLLYFLYYMDEKMINCYKIPSYGQDVTGSREHKYG